MDPFTILAGATAIYSGLKSAVSAGEDVVDTARRVSSLMSEVAKVVQLVSLPRKKRLFQSTEDFEAEAMKLYSAKAKANQLALDAKNLFISQHGKNAWDYIQKQVAEMKREAARQARLHAEEMEEARKDAIFVGSIVGGLIIAMGVIGLVIVIWGA
jgi:S-formylglutathione hydrolase FrmB